MSTKQSTKSEQQQNANEIRDLLKELAAETDQSAKKSIRRKLRTRDYYISREKKAATKATKKAATRTRAAKQSKQIAAVAA